MDWRHIWEMMEAGKASYTELKAVCVWNKTNGGMGSFYRSKHEFVFVFKNGSSPHVNNIELGSTGRYRTNVWDYAGVNTFRAGRDEDLATHPTVKPVALAATPSEIVPGVVLWFWTRFWALAPLSWQPSTPRRAAGIEIEPSYVDAAIRRWQTMTGGKAVLAGDGRSFDQLTTIRAAAEVDHG